MAGRPGTCSPIPANLGPLPAGDGSPQPCSIEYYWGRLVLTAERAFEIRYNTRKTCSGADLSRSDGNGRYRLHGSEIEFIFPQSDVGVAGEVRDHGIVWEDVHEFLFQRTD